jgi:hypothetical protein
VAESGSAARRGAALGRARGSGGAGMGQVERAPQWGGGGWRTMGGWRRGLCVPWGRGAGGRAGRAGFGERGSGSTRLPEPAAGPPACPRIGPVR